ncbi:MAG: hypothetical protein L6Q92_07765 [Phycisphaerae bacterium]|nr:hypothetical protein [Phycisphaerae bacterium]
MLGSQAATPDIDRDFEVLFRLGAPLAVVEQRAEGVVGIGDASLVGAKEALGHGELLEHNRFGSALQHDLRSERNDRVSGLGEIKSTALDALLMVRPNRMRAWD